MRHYPAKPAKPGRPKRNGSTRAWRNTRARILTRDHRTCQQCGEPATHVDHVTPRSRGGTDDDTNLQALCGPCNLEKGTL